MHNIMKYGFFVFLGVLFGVIGSIWFADIETDEVPYDFSMENRSIDIKSDCEEPLKSPYNKQLWFAGPPLLNDGYIIATLVSFERFCSNAKLADNLEL